MKSDTSRYEERGLFIAPSRLTARGRLVYFALASLWCFFLFFATCYFLHLFLVDSLFPALFFLCCYLFGVVATAERPGGSS